jgi:hypothetical protein
MAPPTSSHKQWRKTTLYSKTDKFKKSNKNRTKIILFLKVKRILHNFESLSFVPAINKTCFDNILISINYPFDFFVSRRHRENFYWQRGPSLKGEKEIKLFEGIVSGGGLV